MFVELVNRFYFKCVCVKVIFVCAHILRWFETAMKLFQNVKEIFILSNISVKPSSVFTLPELAVCLFWHPEDFWLIKLQEGPSHCFHVMYGISPRILTYTYSYLLHTCIKAIFEFSHFWDIKNIVFFQFMLAKMFAEVKHPTWLQRMKYISCFLTFPLNMFARLSVKLAKSISVLNSQF